ncbi:HEAT repeat domain-containing protein [Paludisphaera soli]|uniref:HEAT repeat domain-containing protein n=1 Tax=Paludisphaera soli TaxID=2712865 RepID=UPI0013EB14E9|nr:HEAT repeat domain-containing protein [Paludisphaera soli]
MTALRVSYDQFETGSIRRAATSGNRDRNFGMDVLPFNPPYGAYEALSRNTQPQTDASAASTRTGILDSTFFKQAVEDMIRSPIRDRATHLDRVSKELADSDAPLEAIETLIQECVQRGGTDGLDIAVDILCSFGDLAIKYAVRILPGDISRWDAAREFPRFDRKDEVWYILLRAVGRSNLSVNRKFPMLSDCVAKGNESIRLASIQAIGDMGGPTAVRLLKHVIENEVDADIREAASEVLDDLEA